MIMICCLVVIGNYFGGIVFVGVCGFVIVILCDCLVVLGFTFGLNLHWILLFALGLLVIWLLFTCVVGAFGYVV